MDAFMQAAFDEAQAGFDEGGIPIGSVIVRDGEIVSRGRNRQQQTGSNLLHAADFVGEIVGRHAENDALEAMGWHERPFYRECVLYTTLSPCCMCAGALVFYEIPRIVIGDVTTFPGEVEWVRSRGVVADIEESQECIDLLQRFIREKADVWKKAAGL